MNEGQGRPMGPRDTEDEKYKAMGSPQELRAMEANRAASGMLDRGSRESARGILERRIHEFERKAIALRELSNALPLNLPPMADEALWQMLVNIR